MDWVFHLSIGVAFLVRLAGWRCFSRLLCSFTRVWDMHSATFCWQFLLFNVIEDTGFYWVHRWMHTPWAYKTIHVQHHLYDPPFSLSGELMHPAEFLFNVLVPLMLGPFLVAWYSGLHGKLQCSGRAADTRLTPAWRGQCSRTGRECVSVKFVARTRIPML